MTTAMKVKCAWCGKDIGTKDGKGQTGTTHGICKECLDKELKKYEEACNQAAEER